MTEYLDFEVKRFCQIFSVYYLLNKDAVVTVYMKNFACYHHGLFYQFFWFCFYLFPFFLFLQACFHQLQICIFTTSPSWMGKWRPGFWARFLAGIHQNAVEVDRISMFAPCCIIQINVYLTQKLPKDSVLKTMYFHKLHFKQNKNNKIK